MTDHSHDNLIRLREVMARVGMARSTIYNHMAAGSFPQAVRISKGLVAWHEGDINAWVADPMGWRADG
jgi:prophage regulatory protein